MSYRAWPAALLGSASLAAACVVVGGHVVEAGDGCLGAQYFVGTPTIWSHGPSNGPDGKPAQDKAGLGGPAVGEPIGEVKEVPASAGLQIIGCLDVDRIEVPASTLIPDGRA